MKKPNGWFALHPQTTKPSTATVLDSRAFAYGDGFFTTMAVSDGLILWSDYHQQRLNSHAQALQLNIDSQILLNRLQAHAHQLQQGIMKLIISRAAQAVRGYGFTADDKGSACDSWLQVTAMAIDNDAEQLQLPDGCITLMQPTSKAVCLTSQLACLPPPLAGLKTLNRLDTVLASGELQRLKMTKLTQSSQDIGEGLLRDMSGCWIEGTMSNVFYQLADTNVECKNGNSKHTSASDYLPNGQWHTPSMSQSGVAGIMRQVLIDALAGTDKPIIIRPLVDKDLPQLSRLFFCNAVRGIMPMSALTLLSGQAIEFS